MDDIKLVITKPVAEVATIAVEKTENTPVVQQHNPQDINVWVDAFGDCV